MGSGYGSGPYGSGPYGGGPVADQALTFRVADSLTGKLLGRLRPSAWTFDDPVTGSSTGSLTMPLPTEPDDVALLVALTRPLVCQIGAQDEQGRWWFGGPITAEPVVADRQVTVTFADWRAWFYASVLDADVAADRDFGTEQMELMASLVAGRVAGPGAPYMVVDNAATSNVVRRALYRQATMIGENLDDLANRADGPDWWTYLATDPADDTRVQAHVRFEYPERNTGYGLYLRYDLGNSGNLFGYDWPAGNVPNTRIVGTQGSAPDQLIVTSTDPAVTAGDALAWDEVYALPDGVNTSAVAYEYTQARLTSRAADGTVVADLDPAATDLGAWGPGDRARLSVKDGWRNIDKPSVRVISRSLEGRGGSVTSAKVSIALSEPVPDIAVPDQVVI